MAGQKPLGSIVIGSKLMGFLERLNGHFIGFLDINVISEVRNDSRK